MSETYSAINQNYKILRLFTDCLSVFELMDNQLLFQKLQSAGIRGTARDWFLGYQGDGTEKTSGDQYSQCCISTGDEHEINVVSRKPTVII